MRSLLLFPSSHSSLCVFAPLRLCVPFFSSLPFFPSLLPFASSRFQLASQPNETPEPPSLAPDDPPGDIAICLRATDCHRPASCPASSGTERRKATARSLRETTARGPAIPRRTARRFDRPSVARAREPTRGCRRRFPNPKDARSAVPCYRHDQPREPRQSHRRCHRADSLRKRVAKLPRQSHQRGWRDSAPKVLEPTSPEHGPTKHFGRRSRDQDNSCRIGTKVARYRHASPRTNGCKPIRTPSRIPHRPTLQPRPRPPRSHLGLRCRTRNAGPGIPKRNTDPVSLHPQPSR